MRLTLRLLLLAMKFSSLVALAQSERELGTLIDERLRIDDKIVRMASAVRSLANLVEDDLERVRHLRALDDVLGKLRKPGLSQMIMNVLYAMPNGLTPAEIMNTLVNSGSLEPKEYTNPAASIHTTLRRLVEAGKLEPKSKEGKKIFRIRTIKPGYGGPGKLSDMK